MHPESFLPSELFLSEPFLAVNFIGFGYLSTAAG
jgi:hypothetical protein